VGSRRGHDRAARDPEIKVMTDTPLILVAGAGGFIGGHLVAALRGQGHRLRAVDMKPLDVWWQRFDDVDNHVLDLRRPDACAALVAEAGVVYNLAADMGGMGFIESHRALCMLNVLINTNLLEAARAHGVRKLFFASSACVYPVHRQAEASAAALKESDAYPAMPEDGYGWEKLFSERMCRHFREDFGLGVAVARLHNVYGPRGAWRGGREKAPAAICRKVIEATLTGTGEVEIWGDGRQSRTFTYVDDCLRGIELIMESGYSDPVNLGSSERVTIDQLVDVVEEIAGVRLRRRYLPGAPSGVAGRASDNTLIKALVGWEPSTQLRDGLAVTYGWIRDQMLARAGPAAR
jgi:nucleoside-diphosphate-sugar epimerase